MRQKRLLTAAAALGFFLLAGQAFAAEPRLLGKYSDWEAYVLMEEANKVCYMASQPKKEEGNYARRGDVFALITHRPAEGTKNVFSYMAGYAYKAGSDAAAKIGDVSFTLFTQDEAAWAPDAATDDKIADAVRRASDMVVKGTSSRGTATTDTFSLKGSSAAYEAISKECGVR